MSAQPAGTALQLRDERPAAAANHSYGLFRVGATLLALHVDQIREVIPQPRSYSSLPSQPPALCGAFTMDSDIIPVLDLGKALALPPADHADPIVVVMRWRGHLLGLLADKVSGMVQLPDSALVALSFGNNRLGGIATHGFQHDGDIGALLDPAQIAALADVPLLPEQSRVSAAQYRPSGESMLLFTARKSHFAIEAAGVHGTVPRARIERSALTMGYCLGVSNHDGTEIPVVDTLDMLQIAEPEIVLESPLVVLRFADGGLLGVTVDEVRDVVRINIGDIVPVPPIGRRATALFRGLLTDATGRQNIVLDVASLHNDPHIRGLASVRKDKAAPSPARPAPGTAPAVARPAEHFLMYKVGVERASVLTQIAEILPMQARIAPIGGGPELLGLISHRGVALPLVCLATILGLPRRLDPDKARILVVRQQAMAAGFVVEELRAIEAVRWDLSPAQPHDRSGPSMLPALLMFGDRPAHRLVSHIDLEEELRIFAGVPDPASPENVPALCAA